MQEGNPTVGRRVAVGAAVAGLGLMVARRAAGQADSFPSRPVRILSSFSHGSAHDLVSRLTAKHLSYRLQQPVTVDNRLDSLHGVGVAELAASSSVDGYTLVMLAGTHASDAAVRRSLPFHPVNDFAWIGTVTTFPMVIAVRPDSSFQSLKELLDAARTAPNRYSYGSQGVGSAAHLVGEWLFGQAEARTRHVPESGGRTQLTDLRERRIDLFIDSLANSASALKDRQLRPLAVTSPAGQSALPGVLTVAELFSGVVFDSWLGLAAPGGTPKPVVARLNAELRAVVSRPDIRQRLTDWASVPHVGSPEEFRARVSSDIRRLREVAGARGIVIG